MTDLARDFMRELSVVERAGFSTTESMRLFIDQAFYALHGRTVTGAAFDDNERRYMANVERLRDPSAHPALARALGIVALAVRDTFTDFLGPLLMETSAVASAGQFLTPQSVADMMAALTIPTDLPQDRVVEVHEPACGSGVMVLSTARAMVSRGIPLERQHYVMVDVDERMARAAYIQTTLAGIPATVVHGNTITLETWSTWETLPRVIQRASLET